MARVRIKAWLHELRGQVLLQDHNGRALPYRAPGSELVPCIITYHTERPARFRKKQNTQAKHIGQ